MGKIVTVYNLNVHLDERFRFLAEAQSFVDSPNSLMFSIPHARMQGEDGNTRRISVCDTLTACATALDVQGPFHRCLLANADMAEEYAEDLLYSETEQNIEQYPIAITEIQVDEDFLYTPSQEEVPDADLTDEKWLRGYEGIVSVKSKLVWVNNESVLVSIDDPIGDLDFFIWPCDELKYSETPYPNRHHPWLDGKGHLLNSKKGDWEDPDTQNGWGMNIIPL